MSFSKPKTGDRNSKDKRASSINHTNIDIQIDLEPTDDDLNVSESDDDITSSNHSSFSHDLTPTTQTNQRTPQYSISIKGGHHAENSRISFDDYRYDPSFAIIPHSHSNIESQIDVGDEEEDEYDKEEEEEDDEYETEEKDDGSDNIDPADEIIQETPSQEELKRQRAFNKKLAKEKKDALIDEYLHEMKHFSHVWARNTVFRLRVMERIEEKQTIIKKYFHHEIFEQSRTKEAESIKALHLNDNCAALKANKKQGKRNSRDSATERGKLRKSKQRKVSHRVARFSNGGVHNDLNEDTQNIEISTEGIPDVSLNTLGKRHNYNIKPLLSKEELVRLSQDEAEGGSKSCRRQRYKSSKRLVGFSFLRSKFFIDEHFQTKRRNTDLMGLSLGQLAPKNLKTLEGKGPRPLHLGLPIISKPNKRSRGSQYKSLKNLTMGAARKRIFEVSQEANHLAKSKQRMALDKGNLEQKIRLESNPVDPTHLCQFKFEFADPRLTAKQATTKLRSELINMLKHRQIPTSQLQWPLEIKGINFDKQNPFGRVSINYTRASHSEREHPHTAYRILLTNIAYLRQKEKKMTTVHAENMVEMEAHRETLLQGMHTLYDEIVEGLRIWASVSGSSTREKKVAIAETEKFIEYFQKVYSHFLIDMLIHLYKTIYATEFALRRLSISEGKGEGAELHEFKDIMRCREKLKSEHKDVQQVIGKYQGHSMDVLKLIRKANTKLHSLTESLETMSLDTKHVTRAVTTMIDGMYYCQRLADNSHQKERLQRSEAGLYAAPRLAEDYKNILNKIEASKSRKIQLRHKYNAKLRELRNINPMRWR